MIYPMYMNVVKLHQDAIIPTRANSTDAGLDLYAYENIRLKRSKVRIWRDHDPDAYPHDIVAIPTKIPTGIAIELPRNSYGLIKDRSSLGSKGIIVSAGVIDSEYRGEIIVCLINLSGNDYQIKKGDKIAQLIVSPYIPITPQLVNKLSESNRGDQGFGSSGR